MFDTVYHNGRFKKTNDVHISINDRGFLYGHSVYESICIIDNHLLLFDEHVNRLYEGLKQLSIPIKLSKESLKKNIKKLCEINGVTSHAKCYIQITAGDTIERNYSDFGQPNIIIRLYEWQRKEINNHKVILIDDLRWGLCHVKSNSLAYNALAGKRAHEQNAIEVIFIRDNFVQECSTSNIFICQENKVYTPDKSQQFLHGVTRQWVIDQAQKLNINVIEKPIHIDELYHADEVFITASYKGIHPITSINDKIINQHKIGTITKKLKEAYHHACHKINSY